MARAIEAGKAIGASKANSRVRVNGVKANNGDKDSRDKARDKVKDKVKDWVAVQAAVQRQAGNRVLVWEGRGI